MHLELSYDFDVIALYIWVSYGMGTDTPVQIWEGMQDNLGLHCCG